MVTALVVLLALAWARDASADKVDRLIAKMQRSSDYKVRLSAALNLAKLRDKRAIPAFMRALADEDKTVRGVAAAALGKIIDSSVSSGRRKQVLSALKRAATKDSNAFVRKQAQKAYDVVKAVGAGGGSSQGGGKGKIFVDIGPMSSKASSGKSLKPLMRKTAVGAFKKKASAMKVEWPGKKPSKRQLSKAGYMGFHVDGTLVKLSTSPAGSGTNVSCKVSMLLATYPEKSMFGFLNGGAKVQAGKSDRDVQFAKQDCVAAVVEDLIARKIIPTIKVRAR
jgi:hypothetical protein